MTRSYLIKVALARLEYVAPSEFTLATGRLLQILADRAEGIDKPDLLRIFYHDFEEASAVRRRSLEACLSKLIQRARTRYLKFGLDIHFCKLRRRWILTPVVDRRTSSGKVFPSNDNYQAM